MSKCSHFSIKELVSPAVYKRYGEDAWATQITIIISHHKDGKIKSADFILSCGPQLLRAMSKLPVRRSNKEQQ